MYHRVIKCDASGTFTCNLPPQIVTVLGIAEVQGISRSEVLKKVTEIFDRYRSSRLTEEKVILYEVKYHAYIYNGDRCVFRSEQGVNELSFCHGTGISVAAAVCTERCTTEANGNKTYEYDEIKSSLPCGMSCGFNVRVHGYRTGRKDNLLPWTQERENFFAKIGNGLDAEVRYLQGEVVRMKHALQKIAAYPVHSEPMGGALAMQDIAHDALHTPNIRS